MSSYNYKILCVDGSTALCHHGIKGMKWGFRRFQNPDGSLTPEGRARYLGEPNPHPRKNQTVFVSGSSKTQDKSSGYYRKRLPSGVRYELKEHMKRGDKIIVGDAPGIDRQTQDYLAKKGYKNVEVFSPGKEGARYLADTGWKQTNVDNPKAEVGSTDWLAAKDFVMSKMADVAIAVTIEDGATATRKNVDRLVEANKEVSVYELGRDKGRLGNLLGLRDDKSTTFINGKEVSEDYYDGYWISDPNNVKGVVPEHEYGTRTREIAAKKLSTETKLAEQKRWLDTTEPSRARVRSIQKQWESRILDAEKTYYSKNKKGDLRPGYSALVKSMRKSGLTKVEIERTLGLTEGQLNYIIYGKF